MIALGLAIAAILPVPWGWKIGLFLGIMFLVGILIPAVGRARKHPFWANQRLGPFRSAAVSVTASSTLDHKQYRLDGAIMAAEEVRRTVEDLAQALYEEKDPSGIPWVKRGQAVRDPWLRLAQKQIAESDESAKG
jgi:hypothetical protein